MRQSDFTTPYLVIRLRSKKDGLPARRGIEPE